MAEITDKGIVYAALDNFAKKIWHEVEGGSRYFGLDLYIDLFERTQEIKKSIKEGETEHCLQLPVD